MFVNFNTNADTYKSMVMPETEAKVVQFSPGQIDIEK